MGIHGGELTPRIYTAYGLLYIRKGDLGLTVFPILFIIFIIFIIFQKCLSIEKMARYLVVGVVKNI